MLRIACSLSLALVLAACSKDARDTKAGPSAVTPVSAGTVGADGVRRISIEANAKGYVPDRIGARPGEKLVLVFTRTVDSTCIAQLKTPDGKLVDLPKGAPVEVPVTVPASGEVAFACGMDMFHGVVVAEKG
ncbi:MAG TPA: cupredoxin domain-containing protein [Kofleriaceae bacterium]|nr:cupredoxin domain-containing protein [Kofleriaceae bacterium]